VANDSRHEERRALEGAKRSVWSRSAGLALLLLGVSATSLAQFPNFTTEYPVPPANNYFGCIAQGPDGALWFTETAEFSNNIGRVTTAGAITEYLVPTFNSLLPSCITAGPDGALWFTEGNGNNIGRITTAGAITEYPIPTANARPMGITAGPDGALWFTESTKIGRITTTGTFTEYALPAGNGNASGIVAGPDGALWFAEESPNIGRITTAGAITVYAVPSSSASNGIAAGPDGALWFTETLGNRIGRITTPPQVAVTEYAVPTAKSDPENITAGPDGALWFTEQTGNNLGRITTAGAITEYAVPAAPGEPIGICVGPDSALWITDSESGILRAAIAAQPPPLALFTSSPLPDGSVGALYLLPGLHNVTLSATGGAPPYAWAVSAGSLPAGLALDPSTGQITGTPTASGAANFTAQVTDSSQAVATKALSLTIDVNNISQFPLPQSSLGGITAGPDGALWFTETSNRIGRIDTSGVITGFAVPSCNCALGLTGIASGSDGALWFASGTHVARITTAGAVTEYAVPGAQQIVGITAGPDEALWFTDGVSAFVGRITTAGVITEFTVSSHSSNNIQNITTGPDGALWFTENAGATYSIGRITTAGAVTEFPVLAIPGAIAAGSDGALWFTAAGTNYGAIGRITTAGVVTYYGLDVFVGAAEGIALGPDGALWFTDAGTESIGQITVNGVITEYPIPIADQDVGPPGAIAAGPDGALWFNQVGGGFNPGTAIGRIPAPLPVPTLTSITPNTGAQGAIVPVTLTGTGFVVGGTTVNVPAGITLSNLIVASSTQITVTFTIAANAAVGPANVTVTTAGGTSQPVVFTITAPGQPPTITTTSPLPSGTVGANYSQTLTATGGTPPYTWILSQGTLPTGLSLNGGSGQISGITTTAGTSNFTIQVIDINQATSTKAFALTVNPALAITSTSPLPAGTVGVNYSQTLTAAGGTPPLVWSIAAGALPAGLLLNSATGQISGTPTTVGPSNFTAQVSDINGASASQPFALTINAPNVSPTITTVAGCCETAGAPGTAGYSGDGGPATSATLNNPHGVAFDSAGNFYIADQLNFVVRKVTVSTGIIATVAGCCETNGAPGNQGYGGDGGPATSATLNKPQAVALDTAGNLYIADQFNCIIRVVNNQPGAITVAGVPVQPGDIQTVAGMPQSCGYGGDGGPAIRAKLATPYGVAVDAAGNIDIADSGNCVIRQVTTAGIITTVAGAPPGAPVNCGYSGDNGPATAATLNNPVGVAVDAAGNIYVGDNDNNVIRVVNTQASAITVTGVTIPALGIQTVAGCCETNGGPGTQGYSGDGGAAVGAELSGPTSAVPDSAGNIYIGDGGNSAIRMVTSAGIISTVAGCCEPNGIRGYTGDGGPATSAELYFPNVVAVGAAGNFIFSDNGDNVVRMVGPPPSLPSLTATPTSLGFSYQQGGSQPSGQVLNIASSIATSALSFTAAPSVPWLSVTPGSGNTPAGLSVSVNTAGLAPNTYSGSIVITSAGAANSPLSVPVILVVAAASAPYGNSTVFNVPGAGTGAGQGTYAFSVNDADAITGHYIDPSGARHGFVGSASGTITTFDAPGAGTGAGQGTGPLSINGTGAIAGYYVDANNADHGFVQVPGAITTFNVPGAKGTVAYSINDSGTIAGPYTDASNVYHGFVRAASGTITTFDAPSAGTGANQGTTAGGINDAGTVGGFYTDASNANHGFVRAADGTITTFDAPGAGGGAYQGTAGYSINGAGTIVGNYVDANTVSHGFVRAASGTITTFDPPGIGTGNFQGTYATGINDTGAITGQYIDSVNVNHGFVRLANGTIATFDVAGAGTGANQGTLAYSINDEGAVTGYYIDAGGVAHAFVTLPNLVPAPTSLTFNALEDGAQPSPQTLAISSPDGSPVPFTATASTNIGVTWLSVSPASGTTGASVTVSVAPFGLAPGTYTGAITILGTDAASPLIVPVTLNVQAVAPTIVTTSPLPGGTLGASYSLTLAAGGGTPPYTWTIVSGALPAGLSLNPANGLIGGIPTAAGIATFNVQVTDSLGLTATKSFSLSIGGGVTIITTSPLPAGTVSAKYSQTLTAAGGAIPYTWLVSAGSLPAGLALSAATGVIGGTPTTAGAASFTIQVTDANRATATAPFTLTINPALTISNATLPSCTVGANCAPNVTLTGGTPPYTYVVIAGALPAGLSLNSAIGQIIGTPTAAGVSTFTVQVTDGNGATTSQQYTLTVNPPPSIVTASPLTGGTINAAYALTLQASSGTPPYTWAVSAGALPAGLKLNTATGQIGGTPTAGGKAIFTIQVTDANGATASAAFTLTIAGNPAITTATLPSPVLGAAYSFQLVAAGTAAPFTWSVSTGALPTGLALSAGGLISGTPLAPGAFTFTVLVTDASKNTASVGYTLTVSQVPVTLTITAPSGTAMPQQQIPITLTLPKAYPVDLAGKLTLQFTPNPAAVVDPAIQFSTGGDTVTFQVPAGQTSAVFPQSPLALQTGTVAGAIVLTATATAGGVPVTLSNSPGFTVSLPQEPPSITVSIQQESAGFNVVVTGYSNTRDITQATFTFTPAAGSQLQSTTFTPSGVGAAFQGYYASDASTAYGSQFVYTQPFNITSGSAGALQSVTVTLTNSQGVSSAVTVAGSF